MDAQSRIAETASLVALTQSIARLELEEGYASEDIVSSEEMLAENRFLAARDGVGARLIDPTTESLRPVNDQLIELLESVHPTPLRSPGRLRRNVGLRNAGASRGAV